MKTKPITLISLLFAFSLGAALAQPQAVPPAPPAAPAPPAPPAPPGPGNRHEHDRGPKTPVIFLGVESSPVPSVLSEQLGLPKGFGLVVDYVVPDSPAAAAGLQQNDVLRMLNDQILLEPNQLRKLLQSFPDGSSVTLTILRKGQEQKLTARLTKKEVPRRDAWNWPGHGDFDFNFGDMGNVDLGDLKERLQDMKEQLKEQAEARKDMIRETVMKAHEAAERARDEARKTGDRHIQVQNTNDSGVHTTRIDVDNAQIVVSDDKGELRLDTVDGKRILTAKDPKGMLLFSGPVDAPQDVDKLPPDVRKRYDQLRQRDLPSVVSSQTSNQFSDEDEDDSSDADDDQGDGDDDSVSPEQVSVTPQNFPRSLFPLYTILI
jgi:hypothetical protein